MRAYENLFVSIALVDLKFSIPGYRGIPTSCFLYDWALFIVLVLSWHEETAHSLNSYYHSWSGGWSDTFQPRCEI